MRGFESLGKRGGGGEFYNSAAGALVVVAMGGAVKTVLVTGAGGRTGE